MAPLIEAAGLRAGTAAVVVVAVVVVVVVVVVAVAVAVAAGRSAAAVVTADLEADSADAPNNRSNGRMAAHSGAALAILYRLLPAHPEGAGRI